MDENEQKPLGASVEMCRIIESGCAVFIATKHGQLIHGRNMSMLGETIFIGKNVTIGPFEQQVEDRNQESFMKSDKILQVSNGMQISVSEIAWIAAE